jgi:hypothetical protein
MSRRWKIVRSKFWRSGFSAESRFCFLKNCGGLPTRRYGNFFCRMKFFQNLTIGTCSPQPFLA